MSFSLVEAAEAFNSQTLRSNPAMPDDLPRNVKLTLFMQHVQTLGTDMDQWTEDEWIAAMEQFGITGDDAIDMLEDVASWGMVDNFEWETPLEIATGGKP